MSPNRYPPIYPLQVTASGFQSLEHQPSVGDWGNDSSNPALGLAWTHCVNTRIKLRRDSSNFRSLGRFDDETDENDEEGGRIPNQLNDTDNSSNTNNSISYRNNDTIADPSNGSNAPITGGTTGGPTGGSSRLLTLELSPCSQRASCRYEITQDGVFGLP